MLTTSKPLGLLAAAGLGACLLARPVHASDEQSRDHGSRSAKEKEEQLKPLDYELGLFGGGYAQGPSFGVLGQAGVDYAPKVKRHKFRVGTEYMHEPFSSKTFNFPEEDQVSARRARLVQPMHIVEGKVGWGTQWTELVETGVGFRGDWWSPAYRRDERWSLRPSVNLEIGRSKGWFWETDVEFFYKKFPNYLIADRRIDQQGVDVDSELGYDFEKFAKVSAGFEWEFTDYLDARYDQPAPGGGLERATRSKDYVSYQPYVAATLKPSKGVRIRTKYEVQLNDARFYDRSMTGRDENDVLTRKFIRDYYDYIRHRVSLRVRWESKKERVRLEGLAEYWRRDFRTYEARDAENHWLGELRTDHSVELGGEFSVLAHGFADDVLPQGLYVSAFASHLHRSSNMKREVSLATNFQITRVFLGLELKTR